MLTDLNTAFKITHHLAEELLPLRHHFLCIEIMLLLNMVLSKMIFFLSTDHHPETMYCVNL